MNEQQQFEKTIQTLESQRAILGDVVVDAALKPLREKLASFYAPATTHSSERKLVTIMFADLSGFTALSEKHDPEYVRGLMNDCFNVLVPIVEKYGGVIDKFIGDEIMALFGAPLAHENDAERALRASLEMMDALESFNHARRLSLGMHFGINTGLVVAGGLGSDGRQQYSVMGDAVNLAARLEDASETGQILIGPNTHRLTAPLFRFEMLAPIRVKGKSEPVAVYRLLEVKSSPGPARGIAGLHSPLVGRQAELETIRQAAGRLQTGDGGILAIVADAGLGKSRLVSEVRAATEGNIHWVEGRALSYTEGVSYWVARSLLDHLIGVNPDLALVGVGLALRQSIETYLPGRMEDIYPYLARLRDIPLDAESETRFKDLLPETVQNRIRAAFADLLLAFAAQKPLALVWEDLHWADPSSMGLIESLLPLSESAPILHVLVFRPQEGRVWDWHKKLLGGLGQRYSVMELSPLNPTESAKLVENLLNIENLPDSTRQLILSKSDGNPFFLEELLRSLIDSGLVLLDGDRAVATYDIARLEVPDTLQGVIAARIDRLPQDDKYTLQTASVIGRVFQEMVLSYLLQQAKTDLPVGLALEELQQRELIRWRGELEYIFKHAITRDVTYNSLLIARRKELHRLTAETLEMLFPDQIDELAPTLAYHYEAAESREKAHHYLLAAAERARQTYANDEAIAFYRAAIDQLERTRLELAEPDLLYPELANLYEKLGNVFGLTGRVDEAVRAYEAAVTFLPEIDRIGRARIYREESIAYNNLRRWNEPVEILEKASATLGKITETNSDAWWQEWMDLQLERMRNLYFRQRPELVDLVQASRSIIESRGNPLQRARLFESLVLVNFRNYRFYHPPAETVEFSRQQLAAAELSGNRQAIGRAKVMMGFMHLWRDEIDETERLFMDGLHDVEFVGDLDTQFIAWNYLALVGRKKGDIAMTREWAERTMKLSRRSNNMLYLMTSLGSMAWVEWKTGNIDEARSYLPESLALAAKIPFPAIAMVRGPAMGLAIEIEDWSTAIEQAKILIQPTNQKLPEDVHFLLEQSIQAANISAARNCFIEALVVMREKKMGYV